MKDNLLTAIFAALSAILTLVLMTILFREACGNDQTKDETYIGGNEAGS